MKKDIKKTSVLFVFFVWSTITIMNWCYPTIEVSLSERRKLSSMPEISISSILSSSFMKDFESYAMDQFIYRDELRSLKAYANLYALQLNDNNDRYYEDGHLNAMNYPLNEASILYATDLFQTVYDQYLQDTKTTIYSAVIYDKGYYLSDDYLKIDYQEAGELVEQAMDYSKYIDINPFLEKDDFYYTDTHWKQENLIDVANYLLMQMGNQKYNNYQEVLWKETFQGVYYGQMGFSPKQDQLIYLTNSLLDECVVQNLESTQKTSIYDLEKETGMDLYDVFLSGASPLIEITNQNATNQKELVIFRDSFGSSISPLLIQAYQKITLIDFRYMSSTTLDEYIQFNNQDVLFLYSTLVLNDSATLK